jgi:hypothetical protein
MENNQINQSNPVYLATIHNAEGKKEILANAKIKAVKDSVQISKNKKADTLSAQTKELKKIARENKTDDKNEEKKLNEKETSFKKEFKSNVSDQFKTLEFGGIYQADVPTCLDGCLACKCACPSIKGDIAGFVGGAAGAASA